MKPDQARLMRQWGYEKDTPRCRTCQNWQRAKGRMVDGEIVRLEARCRTGGFPAHENGCCDRWRGKDGTVLK